MYDSYDDLPDINCPKTFGIKPERTKRLIRESLQILYCLGMPIDDWTNRQKEKTAMALLAVGDVKRSSEWKKIKDAGNKRSLTTREIIGFHNEFLGERISPGSYDDIRRKDLQPLLIGEIVKHSVDEANLSDPRRGYQLSVEYARIIRRYGQSDWFKQVEAFRESHLLYKDRLLQKKPLPKLRVALPDGREIALKDGEHNAIQKAVIEEFLPRFGNGVELLYCGDSGNKFGTVFEADRLKELGFCDLRGGKLPDVVAYSQDKDWVFLIEAYHTSNPITEERKHDLKTTVLGACSDKAIYVTAFENMSSYRNCLEELAWETEVWIATEPEHLIHRDGVRFLGPYQDEI